MTRLRNCWSDLLYAKETTLSENGDVSLFLEELEALDKHFYEAMDDDFNTAAAVGVLFETVKLINTWLKNSREGSVNLPVSFFDAAEKELRKIDDILGVIGIEEKSRDEENEEVDSLIEERNAARMAKNFSRSDEIRDALLARGIVLEDTAQGTKWKRKL